MDREQGFIAKFVRRPVLIWGLLFLLSLGAALSVVSIIQINDLLYFPDFMAWLIDKYLWLRNLIFSFVVLSWLDSFRECFHQLFNFPEPWRDVFSISFIYIVIQAGDALKGALFKKTGALWRLLSGLLAFLIIYLLVYQFGLTEILSNDQLLVFGTTGVISVFRIFLGFQVAVDRSIREFGSETLSIKEMTARRKRYFKNKLRTIKGLWVVVIFSAVQTVWGQFEDSLMHINIADSNFIRMISILIYLPLLSYFHLEHMSRQKDKSKIEIDSNFVSKRYTTGSGTFAVGASLFMASLWAFIIVLVGAIYTLFLV